MKKSILFLMALISVIPLCASEEGDGDRSETASFVTGRSHQSLGSSTTPVPSPDEDAGSEGTQVIVDGSSTENGEEVVDVTALQVGASEAAVVPTGAPAGGHPALTADALAELGAAQNPVVDAVERLQEVQNVRNVGRWARTVAAVQGRYQGIRDTVFTRLWRSRIRASLNQRLLFRAWGDFREHLRHGIDKNDFTTFIDLLLDEGVSRRILKDQPVTFDEHCNAGLRVRLLETEGLQPAPEACAFSHDGTILVLAQGKTLFFFSTKTGRCIQRIEPGFTPEFERYISSDAFISALCFSPDDNALCLAMGKHVFVFGLHKIEGAFVLEPSEAGLLGGMIAQKFLSGYELEHTKEAIMVRRLNAQKTSSGKGQFVLQVHVQGHIMRRKTVEEMQREQQREMAEAAHGHSVDEEPAAEYEAADAQRKIALDDVWSYTYNNDELLSRIEQESYPLENNDKKFKKDFCTCDGLFGLVLQEGVPACVVCNQEGDFGLQQVCYLLCQAPEEVQEQIVICSPHGNRLLMFDGVNFYVQHVHNPTHSFLALCAHRYISELKERDTDFIPALEAALSLLFILNKSQRQWVDVVGHSLGGVTRLDENPSIIDEFPFEVRSMLTSQNRFRIVQERPYESVRELFFAGRWLDKKVIFTVIGLVLFLKRYHIWNKPGVMKLLNDVIRIVTLGYVRPTMGRLL